MTPELTPTVEGTRIGAVEATDAVPEELQLGRYKLLSPIGRGGMGVVYTAYDEVLDRIVAVKLLRADRGGAGAIGRFIREAKALAKLSHPNIVAIHDVDVREGRVFLAMEHVRGQTLREVMAQRLPGEGHAAILELFLQAGRGLQAVHRAGLVHRDFKPENVMVGEDGRVRVMDFGLVRRTQGVEAEDEVTVTREGPLDVALTAFGTIVGTPAYMAPEQHSGAPVDARADVYSFCASLYEGLYGQRPFATVDEVQAGVVLDDDLPTPAGTRVPAWLRAVVVRGLRADPGRRWPDMDGLLAALEADPIAARHRRLRWLALVTSIVVVAVVVTSAVIGVRRRLAEARAEALAAEHLAAVEAEVEPERAATAFAAFVDDPAHRGTRALVWGWQRRGDRAQATGAFDQALEAYGHAYADAREPGDAGAALRSIAEVYRATWQTEAFGRAASALEAGEDEPALVALKVDAALRRRDLVTADALLDATSDPALTGARPLLRVLASATSIPVRGLDAVALPQEGEFAAAVVGEDLREVIVLDRALAPARRFRAEERVFLAGGGPWALTRVGERIRLIDVTAPERTLLSLAGSREAYPKRAVDVGEDGRLDLFYLHQSPELGFKRISDLAGAPAVRTAHAGSERTGSELHAIVAGDLDGDGTQEVVASFGGWRAYDLRVFHVDEAGELRLVARAQVGKVPALGVLRRPGGGLALVAAKDGGHANATVFPEPPHMGVAPGVYLLEWTGEELVARERTLPAELTAPGFIERPVVADLDGDGVQEFAVRLAADGTMHTLVVRQTRDGGLSSLVLGHVGLLDALELDGDAASEVLAYDFRTREMWALGVGEATLPARSDAAQPPEPPPPWLTDEVLRSRWTRAEVLARVGLPASAATALRDASALALDPAVRHRLIDRAAGLFAAAGEFEGALTLGARVEDDPELGPEALRRRVEILTELGRFPEAAGAAAALLDHPRRAPALAKAAQAALEQLQPLLDPSRAAELRFDAPLSPGWRIERPLALRRDPIGGALHVVALSTHGRLAALPVRWDGGPALLEVELEVERAEWHTRVSVDLVDANGEPWLGVGEGAGGARHDIHHSALCRTAELPTGTLIHRTVDAAATRHRVVVRAVYFPDRAAVECAIDDEGRAPERRRLRADAAPRPGSGSLIITGHGPETAPHLVAFAIRRISLRGVRLAEAGPAVTAVDVAARALVEGEPREVLAALAAAPAWPQRGALELLAYDDLRDAAGVARTIDGGMAALDDDDAILLLRTRPTLALAAREALGSRALPLLARAWVELGDKHQGDAALEREVLAELRGVEALVPADASQRGDLAALLAARASIHARSGDLARARRDHEAALAALGEGEADAGTRAGLHLALALLLARTDAAVARVHAAAALVCSETPELLQDRLWSDPTIAADPAWRVVLGDRSAAMIVAPSD